MAEAARRARKFIAGVTAYQNHPAHRPETSAPVIWQDGTTRLLDYNPAVTDAPPLVIPSLINRCDILDLERGHSFLRSLADAGFRPFLVDWGMPGETEKGFTLEDYITKRLFPALDLIPGKANILGYCMGGLLALALAALRPEKTQSLSLFATPWDFHKPDPAQGRNFQLLEKELAAQTDAKGHLPVDIIQGLFAALQPTLALEKFSDFAALDPSSVEARRFVLLEDWLQDGVPLAAKVAHETARDWYGENKPARFEWKIGDTLIDPRAINAPAYVAVPGRDRIVPPESALPLVRLFPGAVLHEPMTGHIGMMASAKAPQHVWAPYMHWLKEHA
jgi:polyhydroxyalkanoate synthase subunit PhaC